MTGAAAEAIQASKSGTTSGIQGPSRQPDDAHVSIEDNDGINGVESVGGRDLFGNDRVGNNEPSEDGLFGMLVSVFRLGINVPQ